MCSVFTGCCLAVPPNATDFSASRFHNFCSHWLVSVLTLALHDHNSWPLTASHVWPLLPVPKLIQSPNWLALYSLRMDLTENITFSSSSVVACAYVLPRRQIYQATALQQPSHLVLLSVVTFLTIPSLNISSCSILGFSYHVTIVMFLDWTTNFVSFKWKTLLLWKRSQLQNTVIDCTYLTHCWSPSHPVSSRFKSCGQINTRTDFLRIPPFFVIYCTVSQNHLFIFTTLNM